MASNTRKFINGIQLNPVDPINIQNPQDGDLIVDINDNKLKKYNESTSQFEEISGSGSGGGGSLTEAVEVDIDNNQTTFKDIDAFDLPKKSGNLSIIVSRKTDSNTIDSNITLSYVYMNNSNEYDVTVSYSGDDPGLEFNIDENTDTLQYESSDLAGNGYVGSAIISEIVGITTLGEGGKPELVREVITEPTNWTAPEGVSEIRVVTKYTKFVQISAGYNYSLALDNQGQAWAWGCGSIGQLGDGTTGNKCVPVQVCGDHCFTQINTGSAHSLAIDHQGQAWAWGYGSYGRLGDGTETDKCVPVQVCGDHCFVQVNAGNTHSLAIDHLGQAWTWGCGMCGQLGDGTTDHKCVPVQVCGDHCFTQISAGGDHSLAIDNQGQAWAWGNNQSSILKVPPTGQLGDGTTDNKCVPVQVCGDHCFVQVNAGNTHSLAIDHQGQAWAWGYGSYGRLGDGTETDKCVPVQVCGDHCFVQVNAGNTHSLAIDHLGQAWTWGCGMCGQLGDGTTDHKCVPVQVCGGHCFTQINAGGGHSLAIDHQGQAWAWGSGACGRLGDGTTGGKCVPVQTCISVKPDFSQGDSISTPVTVTPGQTYHIDPYGADGETRKIDDNILNYTYAASIIIEYIK